MHYSEVKAKAKEKNERIYINTKMPRPPILPPNLNKKKKDELIEELVITKYEGIKELYDNINDPDNKVPNKEEIKQSLNDLLLAEEKIKYNEKEIVYQKQIKQYVKIIDSLINIVEILLHIND